MVVIALGSNQSGPWGSPKETIERALSKLADRNIHIIKVSGAYHTAPYGFASEHNFVNAVAIATTSKPALALLKIFKQIEAEAGRPASRKWASRTLDLDIIDYKGRVCNWKVREARPNHRVVLPHPGAHLRAFVLTPLSEIAPFWHHPVLHESAVALSNRVLIRNHGRVLRRENLSLTQTS